MDDNEEKINPSESTFSNGHEGATEVRRYATMPVKAKIQTVEVHEDTIQFNWKIKEYIQYADYGTAEVDIPNGYKYKSYSIGNVKFKGEDEKQKIEVLFVKTKKDN